MQVVTTVGLDIAKSVSQVHGVDAAGQVVVCQLKRRYVLAPEQQSGLTLHRTRHLYIRQQTAAINVIGALRQGLRDRGPGANSNTRSDFREVKRTSQ